MKGDKNSSITRVRPVFQQLLRTDAAGTSWLPLLLSVSTRNQEYATQLRSKAGKLLPWITERRRYADKVLRKHGIGSVQLERCFEKKTPPPEHFLRWLIENPDQMTWPKRRKPLGEDTRKWREALFNKEDDAARRRAQQMALDELTKIGAAGSNKKKWAFEGFTAVDCYLETDTLLLFIEGKRTEQLARATAWYPMRNQLARNLEVAKEMSKGKDYAVMLIVENPMDDITDAALESGWPHLDQDTRKELLGHYLGCVLWGDVCRATGVPPATLPDKTCDVVRSLAKQ